MPLDYDERKGEIINSIDVDGTKIKREKENPFYARKIKSITALDHVFLMRIPYHVIRAFETDTFRSNPMLNPWAEENYKILMHKSFPGVFETAKSK